ncbi:MAG: hypothetical protein AAGG11_16185 [Pseudomonadota bacterium]
MLTAAFKALLLLAAALIPGILLARWWIRHRQALGSPARIPTGPRSTWDRLCEQLDVIDGGMGPRVAQPPEHEATQPSAHREPQTVAPTRAVPEANSAQLAQQLERVLERVNDLERYVRTLPRASHQLDLSPIKLRLGRIEQTLTGSLAEAAPAPAASVPLRADTSAVAADADPNSDTDPAAEDTTEPDDLTRIRGVGPRLKALLAENGVYYFWQIASWTPADVAFMDTRLERFSGRIERDNWIAQARTLAAAGGASSAPATAEAPAPGNPAATTGRIIPL